MMVMCFLRFMPVCSNHIQGEIHCFLVLDIIILKYSEILRACVKFIIELAVTIVSLTSLKYLHLIFEPCGHHLLDFVLGKYLFCFDFLGIL